MNPPLVYFQAVLILDVLANILFLSVYTKLQPWWRDTLGLTIAIETVLLTFAFIPSILALFFHFSRLTSAISGWFDIAVFLLIGCVMIWRAAVFVAVAGRERARRRERLTERVGKEEK